LKKEKFKKAVIYNPEILGLKLRPNKKKQ